MKKPLVSSLFLLCLSMGLLRSPGIPAQETTIVQERIGATHLNPPEDETVNANHPDRSGRPEGVEGLEKVDRPERRELEGSLQIAGVLEAKELVVEAPSLGKTDEQVGVSVAVDRDTVKQTAQIGIMEDVMNTVRILPGVIYTGRYTPYLSVRGGEPDGLTHVLGGALIKYPYHWGGMVSIFNPRIVESVKLSAGIFPVEYGQATIGLLDIHLLTPNDGLKWEVGTSISTLEGYVQIPLLSDNRAGFQGGSRITHYDLVFALTGNFLEEQGVPFSRVPYIYDFYLKGFYRPRKELSFQLNGFVGQDGIGIKALDPDIDLSREIQNIFDFTWTNLDAFIDHFGSLFGVHKGDSFSTRAEDNDILVSFAYVGSSWILEPDRWRLKGGLRIDHGYFQVEENFSLNTLPALGPRLLVFYTPSDSIPITFSLGSGIFSKVPFEILLITRDMGLYDYDVNIPKSFTSVLGGEIQWGDGFQFKIETYYKYLFDRFYNLAPSQETASSRAKKRMPPRNCSVSRSSALVIEHPIEAG